MERESERRKEKERPKKRKKEKERERKRERKRKKDRMSLHAISAHEFNRKKTPPPRGVFLFTMFPNQEPGGIGPSRRICTRFFEGGPLP